MRYIQCPDTKKMLPEAEYIERHGTARLTAKAPNPGSAFWGDRHYENMKLQDGTVVNSRKQHRQYMKDNNLTTIDDFNGKGGTWEKAAKAREASIAGVDSSRRGDIITAAKDGGHL